MSVFDEVDRLHGLAGSEQLTDAWKTGKTPYADELSGIYLHLLQKWDPPDVWLRMRDQSIVTEVTIADETVICSERLRDAVMNWIECVPDDADSVVADLRAIADSAERLAVIVRQEEDAEATLPAAMYGAVGTVVE